MKLLRKQNLVFSCALLVLAGCSSAPEPVKAPPVEQPQPVPPRQTSPQITPKPSVKPTYKPLANDTCGANDLQYLVGKPRTEIPVPLEPSGRRVVCSTCITTQEYRADRQTIVFDTDTGLIKSVTCG